MATLTSVAACTHGGARRRKRDALCKRVDGRRCEDQRPLRRGELRVRAAAASEQQAVQATPASGSSRRAVVAGAGPSGALAALFLARQGFTVTVCDRRESAADAFSSSPTLGYNMGLNERAMKAVSAAGVELPADVGVSLTARIEHKRDPLDATSVRSTVTPPQFPALMASRERLSLALSAACSQQFPALISHRWGPSGEVYDLDLQARTVTFRDGTALPYDLLVAADGVRSRVRTILADQSALKVSQAPAGMGFGAKSFTSELPAAPAGVDRDAWRAGLHVFQPDQDRRFMLGQPNPDGTLNCMLFLSKAQWEAFGSGKEVEDALRRWYPEMPPIRPDQAESLAAVPLPRAPSTFTTTCDALHVGASVVLLGDSGHSCFNGLGQGCNVALESCRVFDGVLREHKGNLETALPAFTRARKPDVDAAARLSALGPATLGSNAMRLAVLQLLGKVLPLCFPPPAILQVTKANVPYSTIERQTRQETMSVLAAVLAPVSLVLCALAGAAGRIPLLARSTTGSVFAGLQVVMGVAGFLAVCWLGIVALQNLIQTGRE